ncbi:hypothetical protein SUNI508_10774 [Seiridium unicorne]|uniref:Chitinase domain-containing protein 1 n=1 Tax=Seiridium unicorne TaxID=138068 RepID=A0ABR2UK54_9PEZI
MEATRRALQLLLSLLLITAAVHCSSDELEPDEQVPLQAPANAKRHPELPVLGYVTPWNPRGKQLVEEYRNRFDIVSPVWYTVLPSKDSAAVYEVSGGPPEDEDKQWYRRLQEPSASDSKSLRITPRFLLDGWNQDDYMQLVSNETRWRRLSGVIMQVVEDMSFDGVVFESAASHALRGPIATLSDALWEEDKTLVLVVPPIRLSSDPPDAATRERSVSHLTDIVDYFSMMTYDMSGPGGHEHTRSFSPDSQLFPAQQQHKVRSPGPNTAAHWILHNMMAFWEAEYDYDDLVGDMLPKVLFNKKESGYFLMGMPLYGYKYPVLPVDEDSGTIIRVGENVEHEFVILRGPGEPVIMSQIQELITKHEPKLQKVEYDDVPEYYFDYHQEDGRWRVFMPTAESMSATLDTLPGVALWEIGQSSTELLETL